MAVGRAFVMAMAIVGCGSSGSGTSDGGSSDGIGGADGGVPPEVALGPTCAGPADDYARASIAVDGQGGALVAWENQVGSDAHVMICMLRGGVWRGAEDVGVGRDPLVALAADGAGAVAWTDPAAGSLVAAPYVGGQLGGPVTVVAQAVAYRDLAVLPDGQAVLLTSGLELRSYHYDPLSGTWDPAPRDVPVGANATIASPRLGTTADGLVAIWQENQLATSEGAIRAARFSAATGVWTSSAELADVVTGVPTGQVAHALDTSPPGHAVAVLEFSEFDVLIASAYQAGAGGWTSQVLHDGSEPSPPLYASGGVDAIGRAWIVWAVQPPLADYQLRGRRFAGGWSETEPVLTTFQAVSVATTVADSGRALLLWIEPNGMSEVLRAAVAEPEGAFAAGPGLDDGFLADEGSLRVATGPNGHTVAAWLAIPAGITAAVIDW